MPRPLALLFGAALSAGCASHLEVTATPKPPPTKAELVAEVYHPPSPPERCVSLADADQALMTRYLEAVALGARRHREPEELPRHAALSADVGAAWEALRAAYRARLLADLAAGRLVSFRLRAQPLARLALIQFEELEADAVARGHPVARAHFSSSAELKLPQGSDVYRLHAELRYGLDNLLRAHSLSEIVADDRHAARLVEGLTAALFVTRAGLPARDAQLAEELLRARQRLLRQRAPGLRPDRAALRAEAARHEAARHEAARHEARRAEVAADEAELHRDRALDAALDASVASEGAASAEPQPRRSRRVR